MRRSQRIAAITKWLVERPHHVYSLTEFAQQFDAAKSTLSEDLAVIRQTFSELGMGSIQTLSGAVGGVKYVPTLTKAEIFRRVDRVCQILAQPQRVLPGGFIYLNDLSSCPTSLGQLGEIFASQFWTMEPDYVVTVETSGIPIALMTARTLNIPLIVVRRISRLTEGPVLTMNYLSGSLKRMETMSLSRRDLVPKANVLIVDDFMKAGGTLRGLTDLMAEFECNVVGKGVLIETAEPAKKLVTEYLSFIRLTMVDDAASQVLVEPAAWIKA